MSALYSAALSGKRGRWGGVSQEAAGDKTFLFPEEFNIKIREHLKVSRAVVRIFVGSYHMSTLPLSVTYIKIYTIIE
jgi:hypothetical protein